MTTGTLRLKCSSGGKVLADVSSCTCAPPNTGTPPQCVPPTPFRTRIATCYAYPQVEAPLNSYQYYRILTVIVSSQVRAALQERNRQVQGARGHGGAAAAEGHRRHGAVQHHGGRQGDAHAELRHARPEARTRNTT